MVHEQIFHVTYRLVRIHIIFRYVLHCLSNFKLIYFAVLTCELAMRLYRRI